MSHLQKLSDQSSVGVSALQQKQSFCNNVTSDSSTTVLEAQKLTAQRLAEFPENLVLSTAATAGSDLFRLKKEALVGEIDKLKDEHSHRQKERLTVKVAELRQTCNADVGVLKEKLLNSKEQAERQHA